MSEKRVDFDGLITKIKFNLKTEVPEIMYKQENAKTQKEIKIKGKLPAKDEFISTLQKLKPFFCDICEIENKIDETSISGVSFCDKGIVIIGCVSLNKNNIKTPLNINSPHILYENKAGFEIPKDTLLILNNIKSKAIEYLNGDTKGKQTSFNL